MKLSDISAFFQKMTVYWPKFENNETIFKTYCRMFELENTSSNELLCLPEYLRKQKQQYYPCPDAQDITQALKEIRSYASNKKLLTPEEAWIRLSTAMRSGWTWERIEKILSPRTKYAIRICGGWEKLRLAESKEYPFLRKDFISACNQFEEKEENHKSLEFVGAISNQNDGTAFVKKLISSVVR